MALLIGESTVDRQLKLRLKAWADANDAALASLAGIVGLTDGDKGDITVSASGLTWTIDANAITSAKIADDNVTDAKLRNSVARSIIGRSANSSGDPADIQSGGNARVLGELASALGFQTITALLDAAFGSTQGMVLYRDSAAWAALGVGTAGQVLTSGGAAANPSWASASGALTLLGTVTTTSGTTQSIQNLPVSKAMLLVFNGVSHGSGSNQSLRVSVSSTNGSSGSTAAAVSAAVAASVAQHGQVYLLNTGVVGNKTISPNLGASGAASTFRDVSTESTVTGIINALQFSPSGGSFDAGSITVWGIS